MSSWIEHTIQVLSQILIYAVIATLFELSLEHALTNWCGIRLRRWRLEHFGVGCVSTIGRCGERRRGSQQRECEGLCL